MPITRSSKIKGLRKADYTVSGSGTLYLFTPENENAATWLRDHTGDESQWLGKSLAVEHRYASDLARQLQSDGYIVR